MHIKNKYPRLNSREKNKIYIHNLTYLISLRSKFKINFHLHCYYLRNVDDILSYLCKYIQSFERAQAK